jgi:hypothetical protein
VPHWKVIYITKRFLRKDVNYTMNNPKLDKSSNMTNPSPSKPKSPAQDFAENLKNNPKEIIAWCKREIKEYQKLIKLLEKKV